MPIQPIYTGGGQPGASAIRFGREQRPLAGSEAIYDQIAAFSSMPGRGPINSSRRVVEVHAVGEDEVAVVELDCPPPTGFGDADVTDGDGATGRIAEVLNDDADTLVTTGGVHPHTFAHRQVAIIRHGSSVIRVDPLDVE